MNGSIFQNLAKFKKILEKIGNFVQNLAQNWADWYIWMGYFFLKNWYLYGSTFKFRGSTSLPKPNLSIPGGGGELSLKEGGKEG